MSQPTQPGSNQDLVQNYPEQSPTLLDQLTSRDYLIKLSVSRVANYLDSK